MQKNKVKIVLYDDYKKYLNYCEEKYGKNFGKLFRKEIR